MNPDIYWSHACVNALKYMDFGVFHYCMQYIIDITRKQKLQKLYEKVTDNDSLTMSMLKRYSCPFPIYIV